ncbi:hypothetical protein GTU79_14735 [Sodalis ligni]|uniref:hypothetical protein n=1 Tax=Sodalis ligni TaxID=2697027 RepID=UPI001BDDDFAA|nr:hypothetical protein [Sodalis ligni]QWA13704.1 hypothetical protein GTU79_14735 [Sodalis ligni]
MLISPSKQNDIFLPTSDLEVTGNTAQQRAISTEHSTLGTQVATVWNSAAGEGFAREYFQRELNQTFVLEKYG